MNQVWDVAVIGGGAAGLAAAAMAGRGGKKVIILEKGDRLGGRAISVSDGGARINLGPHALYRGGAAQRVLERLNAFPTGGAPGPNIMWLLDGEEQTTTAGLLAGRRLSWLEKRQLIGTMLNIRKLDPKAAAGRSWDDQLDLMGVSGRAKEVLSALARLGTYVGDVRRLDAGTAIAQLQKSTLYPDGGWQSIVDGLAAKAQEAGVTVRTRANVTEVRSRGDAIWEVALSRDDDAVAANNIIAAVPPGQMLEWLGERLPQHYNRQLQLLHPVKAACLDLHMRRLPEQGRTFALGTSEPLYFSVHSRWASLHTQKNEAVLHVMRYDDGKELDGDDVKATLERMLDRIQPGWREEVISRRYMPKLTVTHAFPASETQGVWTRPPVDTGLAGLYAAGDWAGGEGHLFDAAMASAEAAAMHVLRR